MIANMARRDPRIDEYIAKSAPFAQPILKHLREIVHAGCPEVEEAMKWSFPHFDHKGIMCSMAAFQKHCAFGFWKSSLVFGEGKKAEEAMGQFGRITSLADLPNDKSLIAWVRRAVQLNDEGTKSPERAAPKKRAPLSVPEDLAAALKKNAKARQAFQAFPPSHQREYSEWLLEAKREETRASRLQKTLELLAEGKPRHWKYLAKKK